MSIKIKICGVRSLDEAQAVIEGGADFVGFQFIPFAKRKISVEEAVKIIKKLPSNIQYVGVFVNEQAKIVNGIAAKCKLTYIQLHGDEPPQYCRLMKFPVIKAFEVRNTLDLSLFKSYQGIVNKFLLDTPHDKSRRPGETFDFNLAIEPCKKYQIMIAGGLSVKNVKRAIRLLHPWGVDVSGSIRERGRIDLKKVEKFVQTVRRVETQL